MASYNELNALIDAYINRNGVQAITGQILNGVLKAMVEQIGRGYAIMGVAEPGDDPGTPDAPEAYFASTTGTYTNFGGIILQTAEFALLAYTPSEGWTKKTIYEGFSQVDATIDANVGMPQVIASYSNGVLSFDFRNLKGNTGNPAGFGTVAADVDANIGTPAVSVESSGPNTAKNMTFHFRNLKGETGVTSVVATVDNTTGNPSCAVSLSGQVLHLDFTGLKGAQGDTGVSADFPITIANNLTTDDPTAALSAAQGVVLAGELSQLEHKVDEFVPEIGVINLARLAESGETAFESGSINATGANNVALDCVRTANAIPTKYGAIAVPDGWELYYVYYYESWVSNTNYTLSTRVDVHTKKIYTLDTTYNLARVIFRKASHPHITAEEFLASLPTIQAFSQIRSSINTIDSKVVSLQDFDTGLKNGVIIIDKLSPVWNSGGYYKANSVTLQSGGGYYTGAVDISQYSGNKLQISFNAITGVSVRACLITDSSDNILSSVEEKSFSLNPVSGLYEAILDIVAGASKAYLSVSTSAGTRISAVVKQLDGQSTGEAKRVVYVDPQNGNDNNAGTAASPFATFAKAIDSTGDDTTIVFTGETNEAVNIRRKRTQRTLRIVGKAGQKSRFSFGEKITSATLVSGDVYSVSRQTFPDRALFPLFQDGVPDTNTLIADGERLPMQRGREYRCDCSVLLPFGSLAELQAAAGLGYYYDTATSTLYFKVAPGSSLSDNPVVIPSANNFCITGNNGSVKVELCNIDGYYCSFDLRNCSGAEITNCSVRYCVSAAGFMYDRSVGIRFVKCEASSVYSGDTGTGDGFNAHSTGGTYTTDDANMRTTSAELVDCWSHDCNDDGFSDHERCESVIRGGLFEYNGKGGVTPSFGSHCSCYGVISRKNANGFFYIGSATTQEGGKYGQMYCENCLAIENNRSAGSSYNLHGGFVNSYRNGVGNRVVLVNCKAIGNSVGYYNETDNLMKLTDCGSVGNTTEKTGTISISNTAIVE